DHVLLGLEERPAHRQVLLRPALVLREPRARRGPRREVRVLPEMHHLVERPQLRRPVAEELPEAVTANDAADRAGLLHVVGQLAGLDLVAAKLVNHRDLPSAITGKGDAAYRPHSLCAGDSLPIHPRATGAGGPGGPRSGCRTARGTPAPSRGRPGRAR